MVETKNKGPIGRTLELFQNAGKQISTFRQQREERVNPTGSKHERIDQAEKQANRLKVLGYKPSVHGTGNWYYTQPMTTTEVEAVRAFSSGELFRSDYGRIMGEQSRKRSEGRITLDDLYRDPTNSTTTT